MQVKMQVGLLSAASEAASKACQQQEKQLRAG
jgi:hypothetical protein